MKFILARLDGTDEDRAVLAGALHVARRFGGHVDALHIRFDIRNLSVVTGCGAVSDLVALAATFERTAVQMEERARANFESWREANGLPLAERRGDGGPVTTRWQEVEGREAEVVMQRGRLADLIVIARPVVDTGFASLTALDAALFSTGRPVLMTPPAIGPGSYDRAVIAWNGSAEAASAVGHALPLLTGIERVGVYSASEPKRQPRAEALIDYLDWHGIAAERTGIDPATGSLGADLLATAAADDAGLIVMGAYSRGRARQLVFGGVTSHMIENADRPVLMAR